MMIALPLASLFALSGYVTIDGVSAGAADSKVTVEVKTSAPVETGDVRSKFANGMMQLYLDGGHTRADRRSFKNEGLEASVLKRTGYAKVEVPLAAALGCVGPVAVRVGETGFSASIKCSGAAAATEESASSTSTKAEVAAEKVAPSPSPSPKAEAPAKVEAEKSPTTTTTTTTATTAEVKAAPVAAAAPLTAAPAAAAAIPTKSSSAMMLPAFVLVGLGVAAYYFKKRQAKKSSLIEILETAQIGPKRQLVVARVNGETMVLGSSEAGITCLTGMHRLPTMGSEGTMSSIFQVQQMQSAPVSQAAPPLPPSRREQFVPFDPPASPQGSGNEFVDEGGILTRLFRARGQEKPQEKFENIELHEFDNLLQESVADQELRHKLSAGFRGKVS